MKKAVKWTLIGLVILAVSCYVIYEAVKPVSVEMMTLAPVDVAVRFRETGAVKPAGIRTVYPAITLVIAEVRVDEGDAVKAGDVLVVMDAETLDRQLETVEAQITGVESSRNSAVRSLKDRMAQQELALIEAKRQLSLSKAELERVKELYATDGATKTELNAAGNAVAALESQIRQIGRDLAQLGAQVSGTESETDKLYESQALVLRTQADALRHDMEKAVVTAPVDGVVSNLEAQAGQQAMPLTPLLQLLEGGSKKVEVFVLAEDVIDLGTGMGVDLLQEGRLKDTVLQGKIKSIAPSATERISSLGLVEKRVRVEIIADGLDAMVNGSDMEVSFTTKEEKQVIAVPKTILFKQDGKDSAWVVSDGKAALRQVETGLETDLEYVVTKGLSAGDTIIRNPNVEGLADGHRVTAK